MQLRLLPLSIRSSRRQPFDSTKSGFRWAPGANSIKNTLLLLSIRSSRRQARTLGVFLLLGVTSIGLPNCVWAWQQHPAAGSSQLSPDVERLARLYRIQIYDTFRTQRAEYDSRRAAWERLRADWIASGATAADEALILAWLKQGLAASRPGSNALLPPLPRLGETPPVQTPQAGPPTSDKVRPSPPAPAPAPQSSPSEPAADEPELSFHPLPPQGRQPERVPLDPQRLELPREKSGPERPSPPPISPSVPSSVPPQAESLSGPPDSPLPAASSERTVPRRMEIAGARVAGVPALKITPPKIRREHPLGGNTPPPAFHQEAPPQEVSTEPPVEVNAVEINLVELSARLRGYDRARGTLENQLLFRNDWSLGELAGAVQELKDLKQVRRDLLVYLRLLEPSQREALESPLSWRPLRDLIAAKIQESRAVQTDSRSVSSVRQRARTLETLTELSRQLTELDDD